MYILLGAAVHCCVTMASDAEEYCNIAILQYDDVRGPCCCGTAKTDPQRAVDNRACLRQLKVFVGGLNLRIAVHVYSSSSRFPVRECAAARDGIDLLQQASRCYGGPAGSGDNPRWPEGWR